MIHYTSIDTPIGKILIAKTEKGVCRIGLPSDDDESFTNWTAIQFPNKNVIENPKALDNVINQLKKYFTGKLKKFSLPLDLQSSPFYKKVLMAVKNIPYGKTASYKQIANRIDNPKAARAVGNANANNPIPIIIPCHRVVASDWSLGGYGGGLTMKRWLLELEGAL